MEHYPETSNEEPAPEVKEPENKQVSAEEAISSRKERRRLRDEEAGQAPSEERHKRSNGIERNSHKRPAKGKSKGRRRRRRQSEVERAVSSPILTAVLAALILILCFVMIHRLDISRKFRAMKSVVAVNGFYDGTVVDGTDISGMTLDEALNHWSNEVEPKYAKAVVRLDNDVEWTAQEMGYSSDYVNVLYNAWNAERTGSLEERYNRLQNRETESTDYKIHREYYDDALVRASVDAIAATVDSEPKDASLTSFNTETYKFEYAAEQPGYLLNREKMVSDIETALSNGGGSVVMEIETVEPSITRENVAANYGMISSAVTNAKSSTTNRLSNIALALSFINGTALEPGETFSFNSVVGERTTDRGFKMAPAYSSGAVTEEVGGGICQVSTTVFNAALKADMKIKERHSHSMTVSYVDPGKDAAVDWGHKDLRFVNTSDDRIYLCCYLTNDKRVRVGIFGKLLPEGRTISIETEKTEDIPYTTDYQVSFELASQETRVKQKGKNGAKATTFKVIYDKDGVEIAREGIFTSTYSPQKEIVEYGQ